MTSPITVNVVFVIVPPEMVNPLLSAEGETPLIILLVNDSLPVKVAIVPDIGNVIFVLPVVLIVVELLPVVIIFPAVNKFPPNDIVFPPILFTIGDTAVPPKSPVN